MKILHLVQNYYPSIGGAQLLLQTMSEGFVENHGDEVTVFTTNAMTDVARRASELVPPGDEVIRGVRVRRFAFWQRQKPLVATAKRYADRLKLPFREYLGVVNRGPVSPAMLLETTRARVDVVACAAFPYVHMYYPLVARRQPVIMLGALHLDGDHVERPILAAIERAQAYIAFTTFERDVLIRNGISPDRIHVVGLGADVASFATADGSAIRARHGIGDEPVVGFIGRQVAYKGCDTLIHAMTTVWDRFPNARLILAGSRTKFSAELDTLVAALPSAKRDRVTIAHDLSDAEKPQWFAACDIFVSVSSRESFGISFVEAWACGKPVIGGRIGAVECVIREGEDGLLVPCKDPARLASAIEALLGDAGMRQRLGRNGRAKVMAEHTWPIVVDRMHAVYERVV